MWEDSENKNPMAIDVYHDMRDKIFSLPDYEPTLIQFRYPVPYGYEVVTRDGRKVRQLRKFDAVGHCLAGVVDNELEEWDITGNYFDPPSESVSDLFLRLIEKKVWLVEWGYGKYSVIKDANELEALKCSIDYKTIYEAILKPII